MMAEHLTEQEIERYRRAELEPPERAKTAAHLAVCGACLDRAVPADNAALAFTALNESFLPAVDEEPFHLSHAEMKRYAEGDASEADRIICESHLESCERCSEELRELSAAVPAPAAVAARRPQLGPVVKWWQTWASLTPARVAVAIALVAVLVVAVMIWRQRVASPTRDGSAGNGSQPTPVPGPSVQPTPPLAGTPEAPMVASLKDGGREIRLDQAGKLYGLDGFDEASQQMVKAALAGEGLTKPKILDQLAAPGITLLGDPSSETSFSLTTPLGEVVIAQRPTLSWRPLVGAASYVVAVFDGNFNRVAQSPPLAEASWVISVPLSRGQVYAWEVTALKDGKEITAPAAPAPRAQFKVLEADQVNGLNRLQGQKPVSHLALGLAYARFGLVISAEREFRQLVRENPDSAAAKKLLQAVQAWRKAR